MEMSKQESYDEVIELVSCKNCGQKIISEGLADHES
jgi:hypothetical protein